jgi:hypothetical protein
VPYPFGADGNAISGGTCGTDPSCYLVVTSLAFRAWNRGLAATTNGTAVTTNSSGAATGSPYNNPYGVWHYNGTRWYPDPTFPGRSVCPGRTILWAGKLDYWLIGAVNVANSPWAPLCRFDGSNFAWEPLAIPAATLAHVPLQPTNGPGAAPRMIGGITSGACYAWNNCWFFGSFGVVVHWDGSTLSDATPPWSQNSFTSASGRVDAAGDDVGVAATKARSGASVEQLLTSSGAAFAPLYGFTLPFPSTVPTDYEAADVDASGQGWLAGNPTGDATNSQDPTDISQFTNSINGILTNPTAGVVQMLEFPSPPASWGSATAEPAPLTPFSTAGADSKCVGPPASRFTYTTTQGTPANPEGAFLWSSISVDPTTGDAVAGGQTRPVSSGPFASGEPVIVQANCDGSSVETTFGAPGSNGVNPGGSVMAVAANADNDAWVATSAQDTAGAPPHLYHLTNGLTPDAPAGDDNETRPLDLQADQPIVVVIPPPPPPPPPVVTTTVQAKPAKSKVLLPAVYDVKRWLKGLKLYLSFKLRRATTIGAEALRHGRVVSKTPLKTFKGRSGLLVLELKRKEWPTALQFITDLPKATLAKPGGTISGTVTLQATVSAYKARHIVSVVFQYSPAGQNTWTNIGTAAAKPWSIKFDTTTVPNGLYDLRVVVTDSAQKVATSALVTKRQISNSAAGATGSTGPTGTTGATQ